MHGIFIIASMSAGNRATLAKNRMSIRDSIVGAVPFLPPKERLRVTAQDSGTYPMDGGGVATCRQIVLEGLSDVRWTIQAEVANDLKTVRFRSRYGHCLLSMCIASFRSGNNWRGSPTLDTGYPSNLHAKPSGYFLILHLGSEVVKERIC